MRALTTIIITLTLMLGRVGEAASSPPALPLHGTRFIAYSPRSFAVHGDTVQPATTAGIGDDLRCLRPWFDGLITYAASNGLEKIPALAQELGFRAVIVGVWDPRSTEEIANAIGAARNFPTLVKAVVVGNEGLYAKRYRVQDVLTATARIKEACPNLAISTSEPFFLYFSEDYRGFFQSLDLVMPNVHPVFEPWFKPSEANAGVKMVLEVTEKFKTTFPQPLLIKESGLPSGLSQAGYSPEAQAQFWAELLRRFPFSATCSLACFEAFDAPWKPQAMAKDFPGQHDNEAFWGFFTTMGVPKPVVAILPKSPAP